MQQQLLHDAKHLGTTNSDSNSSRTMNSQDEMAALQATSAAAASAAANEALATTLSAAAENKIEFTPQQQQFLLQQQQLQLLQLQQQQLQTMSPSDLAAMAAMAQQMLGMVMMPMMPFMMPMNQALQAAAANQAQSSSSASEHQVESPSRSASSPSAQATSEALALQGGDTFANQPSPLTLMGAPFALPAPANDDTPKRKRGRPPKKDVVARAKADAEKTLKQFPMWGYGLPMPLLPGFPGVLAPNALANLTEQVVAQAQDAESTTKEEDSDSGYDKSGRGGRSGKGPAKKKTRGTGKPRGRPRTRPRPGEIIRRAKPPAIAPANYSVMYNYSLSNLAQKSAELSNETSGSNGSGAGDENRLAGIGASLLSGDRE
ncbi:hypothetical protein Gpo141_00013368 [Globisporangium polare]